MRLRRHRLVAFGTILRQMLDAPGFRVLSDGTVAVERDHNWRVVEIQLDSAKEPALLFTLEEAERNERAQIQISARSIKELLRRRDLGTMTGTPDERLERAAGIVCREILEDLGTGSGRKYR